MGIRCVGRNWPFSLPVLVRPTLARLRRGGMTCRNFIELLYAGGDIPVRELVAQLDGCSGGKAGEIVAAAGLSRADLPGYQSAASREASGRRPRQRQGG